MAKIGFIGLGNMGGPMARNLAKAGHEVKGFDLTEASLATAEAGGVTRAPSAAEAAEGVEAVFTMLPAGPHVREVYTGTNGIIAAADKGTLFVDSSPIDVATARAVHAAASAAGR